MARADKPGTWPVGAHPRRPGLHAACAARFGTAGGHGYWSTPALYSLYPSYPSILEAWFELQRRLDKGDTIAVIDVRGPDEFTGPLGHIATARNIPITELNNRLAELAGLEQKPIVLVCRTDKRSAAAAQTLHAAGFSQVRVLRQGMQRWNEAGLPVMDRTIRP